MKLRCVTQPDTERIHTNWHQTIKFSRQIVAWSKVNQRKSLVWDTVILFDVFFIILVSMAFFCDQLTGFLDFVTQTVYQVLKLVFQFRVCFLKPEILCNVNYVYWWYFVSLSWFLASKTINLCLMGSARNCVWICKWTRSDLTKDFLTFLDFLKILGKF